MKLGICNLLFFFALLSSVHSQESITLEKAIAIGLENNYQIKIDDANIRIANNNNTWALAGKSPVIDLNSTFNSTVINDNNPASFLNGTYIVGGLGLNANLSWTVFAGGRINITKRELEKLTAQQRLLKQANINDLIRDIYQAYQNVLLQQERLSVLRESYDLSNDRLLYEQALKEFGRSNSFNTLQFQEAIVTDSINLLNQFDVIQNAKQTLYTILNTVPGDEYKFDGELSVQLESLDPDLLRSALEENNYTIRTLKVIQDLNEINTQIALTNLKPTVSVNTTTGFQENYFKFYGKNPNTGESIPAAFSNRINFGVGATVTWNIYDGGIRKTDIENAKIAEEIAQFDILRAATELENQINTLVKNYNNQKAILQLIDQQLDIVEQNLNMAAERYKSGIISSVDYRAIQSQYLNAAFNKTSSIYNLIITKSELDWLMGTYNSRG